ncbi:dipeptidase [Sphingosinicella terrae]|uniref:dipeptidase n=1 Tax=Sphingosinicella terrae TaxID=2172047 RepID=UPI0013B4717F|nr:membrane dipeptidase [Sphingosinicella terrae]
MHRREFILSAGAAGAASLLPFSLRAQPAPRAAADRSIYVDAQGGIDGLDRGADGRYVASPRLVEAIRARRIDLVSCTIGPVGNVPDAFRGAVEDLAGWNRFLADHPALFSRVERAADIEAARAAGRVGLIYNFQDTVALEAVPDRVDTFASLGVRVIQLTYNKRNLAGDGCLERADAGLSDFGREVIGRINRARLLLDLSHAGPRTIAEGIAASTAPPAITHSGCRALADLPRNTHDAQMRALAEKGGVFGLYLMPFLRTAGQPGREDLLRHLDHAIDVCGEDHVGIGTDNPFLGYTVNDETRAEQRRFFEERSRRGIAAPGEAADVLNLVEGYNDAARYDRMAADLRRRGWSSARIDKVLGGNFVRLFGEVWGG